MQILITGGAGFIGSNFVEYYINKSTDNVINLDLLTYSGSINNIESVTNHPRHEFVEGDIRDTSLVEKLVQRSDVIINFAAESHVDNSINNSRKFMETNVLGTHVLLEASRKHEIDRFIQISTDEVYGEILDGQFKEGDRLNPRNPYSATKASADLLARSYYSTYEIPIIITRSCNNFGPRQHSEKLIPKFINRASTGTSLPIYGDGTNVREWLYVMDNCSAIQHVLSDGNIGEIYNIGSGFEMTNLEVAKSIIDVVGGSEDQIKFVEDRPGHDKRYSLNTSKIMSLGWEPEWTFQEGLQKTANFYLG